MVLVEYPDVRVASDVVRVAGIEVSVFGVLRVYVGSDEVDDRSEVVLTLELLAGVELGIELGVVDVLTNEHTRSLVVSWQLDASGFGGRELAELSTQSTNVERKCASNASVAVPHCQAWPHGGRNTVQVKSAAWQTPLKMADKSVTAALTFGTQTSPVWQPVWKLQLWPSEGNDAFVVIGEVDVAALDAEELRVFCEVVDVLEGRAQSAKFVQPLAATHAALSGFE